MLSEYFFVMLDILVNVFVNITNNIYVDYSCFDRCSY